VYGVCRAATGPVAFFMSFVRVFIYSQPVRYNNNIVVRALRRTGTTAIGGPSPRRHITYIYILYTAVRHVHA